MLRKSKIIVYIYITIAFFGCGRDIEKVSSFGYDYIPDTVGAFIEYDVIEIFHDDQVNIHDTTRYFLKEKIVSLTKNGEETDIIWHRFKKDSLQNPWVLSDVWSARKTKQHYEKIEENVSYLRLLFPVRFDHE